MPDGSELRFDGAGQKALDDARRQAAQLGHRHIGTEHLLLGLLADSTDPAAQAVIRAGATPEAARSKVIEAVGRGEPSRDRTSTAYTSRAKRALERASRLSLRRRRALASTDDLLLGVLDVEGTAGQVLRGLAVDIASLRSDVGSLDQGAELPDETASLEEPVVAGRGPLCACGADLARSLAHRSVISTRGDEQRELVAAYCSECGATLGILPT